MKSECDVCFFFGGGGFKSFEFHLSNMVLLGRGHFDDGTTVVCQGRVKISSACSARDAGQLEKHKSEARSIDRWDTNRHVRMAQWKQPLSLKKIDLGCCELHFLASSCQISPKV